MICLGVLIEFLMMWKISSLIFCVPKVEESIKALYVSMDESKKRTAMLRARREFL